MDKLNADTRAKLVGLYHEGVSTTQLATRYSVTAEWLRKTLYPAYGIKPRMGRADTKFN